MCGSEEELFLTEIEGTQLNVCKNCSRYGKVIKSLKVEEPKIEKQERRFVERGSEIVQGFVPGFNKLIKEKREKIKLKQKEFAKVIAEKESVIHKLESGMEPNMELARKIEKFLKIRLVEEQEVKKAEIKTDSDNYTIGDIIKIKKGKS